MMKIVFKIKDFAYETKWFFQRIIRKHGTADIDLWSLDIHLAKIILPKLVAFRNSNIQGYPYVFSSWEDLIDTGLYKTKKDYAKAIKNGELVGGGFLKWLKVIDEMIFGFEFVLGDSGIKKYEKKFMKKYGNWHEEKIENRHILNLYEENDYLTTEVNDKKKHSNIYYFDKDLYDRYMKEALHGLELFGKYYLNLWN